MRDRAWGTGRVYLRGRRWWISYPVSGRYIYQTSRSPDRGVAEKLFEDRLRDATVIAHFGKSGQWHAASLSASPS